MLERVKAAIAKEMGYRDPQTVEFAARAAIAAMREPTEAMKRNVSGTTTDIALYQAMIDAALKEESHAG